MNANTSNMRTGWRGIAATAVLLALPAWADPAAPGARAAGAAAGTTPAAAPAQPAAGAAAVAPPLSTARLQNIMIPEFDFRDAPLTNVIEYLVQASRDADAALPADQRGVNIVIGPVSPAQQAQTLTFQARHMSLQDALKVTTRICGLRFQIEGNIVMILPRDEPGNPTMVTKMFFVNQASVTGIRKAGPKAYFEKMGISFPPGSSISYDPGVGRLIVSDTPENVENLHRILLGFGNP